MTEGSRFLTTLAARRRYSLPAAALGGGDDASRPGAHAAALWAVRISEARGAADGEPPSAGELAGAAALHDGMHAVIAAASAAVDGPAPLAAAWARWAGGAASEEAAEYGEAFARAYVATVASATDGPHDAGPPTGAQTMEATWLVARAASNPALARVRTLLDDPLAVTGAWQEVDAAASAALAGVAASPQGPEVPGARAGSRPLDLLDLLLAPQRREPTSLAGQLRLAARLWAPYLASASGLGERLLRAADLLEEEGKRAPAAPGPPPPPPEHAHRPDTVGAPRYSPDGAWMPEVAMVAKSTYVWLAQLSRAYGVRVGRLDEVPEAALAALRDDGFNALWLIGVWERSRASRNLKRARGQADAGASAYSLYDYVVAEDLGGEQALAELSRRAAAAGLRLASDMVPNHTGLDSRWLVDHPERFVQLPEPPFPGYSFTGPDLAGGGAVEVRVEDHYYDGSDAAVVFERRDRATGEKRYVYHGNDGTAMPWNDTAQLDYLRADVREAVMRTIEEVAGRFPIIRFDAAMTLARKHVQRLWHPLPGEGGAVPSRARFAMSAAEFERRMPREFWRELVDRMAERAPDTLLLAEAFWLLEGYFVRELGMHRVYNSAFMHMLMREENGAYRRLLKSVLAFDPRVLQRYVNFMSNPDEETAREQFGAGDKYFGVATLLATLPGLPMFGHGQVEGLQEKYGMEYLAPKLDERPDPALVERHRREIAPLLRERGTFAGADAFRLFDLVGEDGPVEDAFVFVNRRVGGDRRPGGAHGTVLVAYNNSPRAVAGRVRVSAPYVDTLRGGGLRSDTLSEALGLREGGPPRATFTDLATGAPTRSADVAELRHQGMWLELRPYEARVERVAQTVDPGVERIVVPQSAPDGTRRLGSPFGLDPRLAGPRGGGARRAARRRRATRGLRRR
ncbi:MAG: hypothetical protein KF875_02410 [Trueperaceae bacterium]|nr:hypothetical protein [Trueperaceae bacterium]